MSRADRCARTRADERDCAPRDQARRPANRSDRIKTRTSPHGRGTSSKMASSAQESRIERDSSTSKPGSAGMCSFVRSLDAARTRAIDTEALDDGRATDLRCCFKRRVMNGLALEDVGSGSGMDIGGRYPFGELRRDTHRRRRLRLRSRGARWRRSRRRCEQSGGRGSSG